MALETSSDLKNVESLCSKSTTLETLSTQNEHNIAQSFEEKRLNLSNISSRSTVTKKNHPISSFLARRRKLEKLLEKLN